MPAYFMREINEPDFDPRDLMDTCPACEGTGWKEVRNDFIGDGPGYCHCQTGQRIRKEIRDKQDADWQAAKDEGLWDHPEDWPW